MVSELKQLKGGLEFSLMKGKRKGLSRSASIAYTSSGNQYSAGNITSDTGLLHITSEQAALSLSVQNNDFKVKQITTLYEENSPLQIVSPLVVKILIDHQARTGGNLNYKIINKKGDILFNENQLNKVFPQYSPSPQQLSKINKAEISPNEADFPSSSKEINKNLKHFSKLGIERSFPTYDSASGYGAAVLTEDNQIYFAGQYSSFDKRLSLHSEMAVMLNVIKKREKITHLGLISSKHQNVPCSPCGCCRQFLTEIADNYNSDFKILCFAKDSEESRESFLSDLLPSSWSNKPDGHKHSNR